MSHFVTNGQPVIVLAAAQHGVVARRQLLDDLGLTDRQVIGLLRRGWLQPVHKGVYRVGAQPLRPEGRWAAALLATPEAALSHSTAAAAWGLRRPSGPTHLTCPPSAGRPRADGIAGHRAWLPQGEVTVHEGFRVTTVARTLLDLGATEPKRVPKAITEAERLRLFDLRDVERVLDRRPGRAGTRVLRDAVEAWDPSSLLTRSELEDAFLALCEGSGIPKPSVNVPVGGYVADFLWPEPRLIVETDGARDHAAPAARHRDHVRTARLALDGYRVERLTYRQVERRPAEVAAALGRWLDR